MTAFLYIGEVVSGHPVTISGDPLTVFALLTSIIDRDDTRGSVTVVMRWGS